MQVLNGERTVGLSGEGRSRSLHLGCGNESLWLRCRSGGLGLGCRHVVVGVFIFISHLHLVVIGVLFGSTASNSHVLLQLAGGVRVHLRGNGPYPGPLRISHGRIGAAHDAATSRTEAARVTVVLRVEGLLSGRGEGGDAGDIIASDSRGAGVVADRWSGDGRARDGTTRDRGCAAPNGAAGAVDGNATGDVESVSHLGLVSNWYLKEKEAR